MNESGKYSFMSENLQLNNQPSMNEAIKGKILAKSIMLSVNIGRYLKQCYLGFIQTHIAAENTCIPKASHVFTVKIVERKYLSTGWKRMIYNGLTSWLSGLKWLFLQREVPVHIFL